MPCHLPTAVSAPFTYLGAPPHELLCARLKAILRTFLADLSAGSTCVHMLLRATKQKFGARSTNPSAVNQHHDVIRGGVLASSLKTLRNRLKAYPGALKAILHTLFHLSAAAFANHTSD